MALKIKLSRGNPGKFLVLAAPRYRRASGRMKQWMFHRTEHMEMLRHLQECRARGDAHVTIDGKAHNGGWASMRELRRIAGAGHDPDQVLRMLRDLANIIGVIDMEPYDGPGPDYVICLHVLPELAVDTLTAIYEAVPYGGSVREDTDKLLGLWMMLYKHEHRTPYRSNVPPERERAALFHYLQAIGNPERIANLMDAFLRGRITYAGRTLKLDLDRYTKYRQHGPTLLTFVKVAIRFARQLDTAMKDLADILGQPIPLWAYPTMGELKLAYNREARAYAFSQGWDGRSRLAERQQLPLRARWALARELGLVGKDGTAPDMGLLDQDPDAYHEPLLLDAGNEDEGGTEDAPPGFGEVEDDAIAERPRPSWPPRKRKRDAPASAGQDSQQRVAAKVRAAIENALKVKD